MARPPTSNSASLVQCLLCSQKISDKSIKRHMAKHDGIEYPCRTCGKTFTQATNRDVHENSSHKGLILVCDVCRWSTGQNAEMTRHKQDKHGHPTRGQKGGVRVSHSVKQVVGAQRVEKRRKRIAPYVRAASSASTSIVYGVSPPAWSPSSNSLLAFSPSYPLLSLSPPPALSSPDLLWNLDQPTVFESSRQTNELQITSSPYDPDSPHISIHDLSESFTENPFSDPEHLRNLMASGMPDAYVSPLVPSTCTPPMTWSLSPSPDPLACSSGSSPADAFFFDEYAFFLDQQRIPEQADQMQEIDSWKGLASDMEFLNEPISHIAPDSLSVFP